MTIRRALALIHRWGGLATGVIVFVVGLTGAVYVWEAELFAWGNRDLVTVEGSDRRNALSADRLVEAARGALPAGRPIIRLTVYADQTRSAVATAQRLVDGAPTYFHEFAYFDEVYLDPSTARVLGVVDRKHEWLFLTRMVHTNLLLADAGTWIVGTATLAFSLLCLIGLVLWWPRTRRVLASRFRPRLIGPWKRAVFDGHNILGTYGLLGMLVLALTGPVWTWRWYTNAIAWTLTGEARLVGEPVPVPRPDARPTPQPLQWALDQTRARVPDAQRYMIEVPQSPAAVLTVGAVYDRASAWEEYERYYYDPMSADLLGDERFEEKNRAMKWRNTNYGIHTATLFGWPTQVLGTLFSLLTASLPVTGVLVWYPRWKRRRARRDRETVRPP
jgi:uncharacterized iron-regulated membrane protein